MGYSHARLRQNDYVLCKYDTCNAFYQWSNFAQSKLLFVIVIWLSNILPIYNLYVYLTFVAGEMRICTSLTLIYM